MNDAGSLPNRWRGAVCARHSKPLVPSDRLRSWLSCCFRITCTVSGRSRTAMLPIRCAGNASKRNSPRYLEAGGQEGYRSESRQRRKERGVWQRRFWEHTVKDESDLERHFDYIHYNPVKHGLVESPRDWPYSS